MNRTTKYRTATLLTAFAALTLAPASFAGFNESSTQPGHYTFDSSPTGLGYLNTNTADLHITGLMTPEEGYAIYDSRFTPKEWVYMNLTGQDRSITYQGRSQIFFHHDSSTNSVFFSSNSFNTKLTLNFSDPNSILDVQTQNEDDGVIALFNHGGQIVADTFAADLGFKENTDGYQARIRNMGLFNSSSVRINNITADSQMSISSLGSEAHGMKASNNIVITRMAGDLSVESGRNIIYMDGSSPDYDEVDYTYGLSAQNMWLNTITKDSHISVKSVGNYVYGIQASRNYSGHVTIDSLGGDITVSAYQQDTNRKSEAFGIKGWDILLGNVTEDSHITTTGSGSHVYGIYADNNVGCNDGDDTPNRPSYDGSITVEAGKDDSGISTVYGIKASHLNFESFGSTSHISATGTGSDVIGINILDKIKIYQQTFDHLAPIIGFAGDITVSAGKNNDGISNAYGIFVEHSQGSEASMSIDTVSSDSHVTVSGLGSNVAGYYTNGIFHCHRHETIANGMPAPGFSGDITVVAGDKDNQSYAYGIYAKNVEIEKLNTDSHISVTGTGGHVAGLYAVDEFILNQTDAEYEYTLNEGLTGDITVIAGADNGISNAYGIYGKHLKLRCRSVTDDSQISVKGTGSKVAGIYGLESGDINIYGSYAGDITVEAGRDTNNVSEAFGIHTSTLTANAFASDSHISITASGSDVAAIKSEGAIKLYYSNSSYNDDTVHYGYLGDITVSAGHNIGQVSNAYGIYSDSYIRLQQIAEDSTISVSGTGSNVYGIYSDRSIAVYKTSYHFYEAGGLDGDIIVSAGTNANGESHAYGIHSGGVYIQKLSKNGSINVTGSGSHVHGIYVSTEHGGTNSLLSNHGSISVSAGKNNDGISMATGVHTVDIWALNLLEGSNISVDGQGSDVYGIQADYEDYNVTINLYYLDGAVNVNAGMNNAGQSNAYGIYSSGNLIHKNSYSNNAGQITVAGTGSDVFGIKTVDHYHTQKQFVGSISATGTDNVYGIQAGSLDLNDFSGTINVETTNANAHKAAISTQYWNTSTQTWEENTNSTDDSVTLATGANIQGDIRLGSLAEANGDTLTLKGTGHFNHNLYGIETINVESFNDKTGTWLLNLSATPETDNHQRNTVQTININNGTLAARNLAIGNLNIAQDGGLHFFIDEEHAPIAVTGNTMLAGTLDVETYDPQFAYTGMIYTLLTADSITGTFDTLNVELDAGHTLVIRYTSNTVTGFSAYNGDTDLSGHVSDEDIARMSAAYMSSENNFTWQDGDFNYDGMVNDYDLEMMLVNTHYSLSELKALMIPEPGTLAMFSLVALPLLRRKRRA